MVRRAALRAQREEGESRPQDDLADGRAARAGAVELIRPRIEDGDALRVVLEVS